MKDEQLYLIHIAECIEKIEQYTSEGKTEFFKDSKTHDAVIRNFEIIGEAVKRLSETTRQLSPQIPWKQFAGFRDILIHRYNAVDLSEVWLTVENDLSVLKEAVKAILNSDRFK